MKKMKIILLVILIAVVAAWLAKPVWKKFDNLRSPKGQASLSWNESEEKNVTYKIYYGTSSRNNDCPPGGYSKSISVKRGHEFVVEDLEPGENYYFSVSAVSAGGKESCFSPEMNKKIPGKMKLFWESF